MLGARRPTAASQQLALLLMASMVTPAAEAAVQPATTGLWPMARHDAQNSGAGAVRAPHSAEPRPWTFAGTGRVWRYRPGMTVWTAPAVGVVDGRAVLVVGSYDHNVYCLDAATGERLWRRTTGDAVNSTPVLWTDPDTDGGARVFATSSDRLVYALDAQTGGRVWIHAVVDYRPTLEGARLTSPAVGKVGQGNAVFVGHWVWDRSLLQSQQEAALTALDAHTGSVLWRQPLGDNELTTPVYVEHGEHRLVLVGSGNGNIYALDTHTGVVRWSKVELDAVRGAPAFAETTLGPRVVYASKAGLVRCVEALGGEEVWRYKTGDWVTGAVAVGWARNRQLVFVGSYDRTLYAVDLLSGRLAWRQAARGGIFAGAALVPSSELPQVIVTSWDHHVRGLRAYDGEPLWNVYTGRPQWDAVGLEHSHWAAPTAVRINESWMVYQGSYDGTFYAFRLADLLARGQASRRSNRGFWLSFPLTLTGAGLVAALLTRKARKRRKEG